MNVQTYHQLPQNILNGIQSVHAAVFDGDQMKGEKCLNKNFTAFVAIQEDEVVGFKLGYEVEDDTFYSWLGGVHPDFRKRGIAEQLMQAQHDYCRAKGYKKVQTFSRNTRKAMLILNIKSGFDILSTFIDEKGRHKILLEKKL